MIIDSIKIEKFRAMKDVELKLGKNLTAISGRNATMKSTILGMLGQPFSISKNSPMFGETTLDGYNYRSQFKDKFKLSQEHDIVGEHQWKLYFSKEDIYTNNFFETISAPRKAKGKKDSIRFINAKGKSKGKGYVQLPVIFLSLSRLYPIGETGKTYNMNLDLTEEEMGLYVSWYKEVFSDSDIRKASVGVEKKDAKHVFAGINDEIHDVFTSSAGEGNIGRIFISILSFRRLMEKYKKQYKGGVLLIDELDATLYGYSQIKMVRLLKKLSEEYKIQIIFTTHSPIILGEINGFQREEFRKNRVSEIGEKYQYYCEIINLFSDHDDCGKIIRGRNVHTSLELKEIVDDINMDANKISQKINVYLEDNRAQSLVSFILEKGNINYSQYINYVDVDMGWSNYVQLYEKNVPEFRNSLIILDYDVQEKDEYKKKEKVVQESDNILFLPIDVEKGMFKVLKNHDYYKYFQNILEEKDIKIHYDVCFKDWVNDECGNSQEYKNWFRYIESAIGDVNLLYETWFHFYEDEAKAFCSSFVDAYNKLAENKKLDYLLS